MFDVEAAKPDVNLSIANRSYFTSTFTGIVELGRVVLRPRLQDSSNRKWLGPRQDCRCVWIVEDVLHGIHAFLCPRNHPRLHGGLHRRVTTQNILFIEAC